MTTPNCSLWFLVARIDVAFMMHTIPHLVKMCDYPFTERVLAVDSIPPAGFYGKRPRTGTLEELRFCCDELLNRGIVDKVVDIDYSKDYRNTTARTGK